MRSASRAACTCDFACLMALRFWKPSNSGWVSCTDQPRGWLVPFGNASAMPSVVDCHRYVCLGIETSLSVCWKAVSPLAEMKGRRPDFASATCSSVARSLARSAFSTGLIK